jgi:hypothetical protein
MTNPILGHIDPVFHLSLFNHYHRDVYVLPGMGPRDARLTGGPSDALSPTVSNASSFPYASPCNALEVRSDNRLEAVGLG